MERWSTFFLVLLVGLAAAGAVVILAVLPSDEPNLPTSAPSPDPLCQGMLPRLKKANRAIEKAEIAVTSPQSEGSYVVTPDELRTLEGARHQYSRIRQRAAAFGCMEN
jgi:hypothetical protein